MIKQRIQFNKSNLGKIIKTSYWAYIPSWADIAASNIFFNNYKEVEREDGN